MTLSYREEEAFSSLQHIKKEEEQWELEKIALDPSRLRAPLRLPRYKRYDKTYIVCAFEGIARMEIAKFQEQLIPRITLRSANMDFLHRLHQRMRVGKIGNLRQRRPPLQTTKAIEITNLHEIAYILKETLRDMRVRRVKRISQLLIEFCQKPNLGRQYQIAEKIKEINEKPNITTYRLIIELLERDLESRKTQYRFPR